MEIKGEYKIAAPRDKVFAALNDQAILQACIPGCESLEMLSPTEPPNGYRISGEGQGGVAGFAKGGAVVTLTDDGGATLLKYDVDAQVGGKIAQVGARLIAGTAKKLADQFFGKFAESVGAPPPVATVPA
jgi:carbon monoxide dehydrogenase subunit G